MKQIATLLIALVTFQPALFAQDLYEWKDESGRTHFSTTPPHQGAAPANLPEIARVKATTAADLPQSCRRHGGIDCLSGPDKDGSVICADGFAGAITRYRFSCLTAKLSITEIIDEGELSRVFVRNLKPVKASKVKVKVLKGFSRERIEGPASIEGHGMAEFTVPTALLGRAPKKGEFSIDCRNCQ